MEEGGRTRALNTQLESRAGLSATKVIKAPARTRSVETLNAMGCLLFSGISVTASKSTPPSVCLGSFPPFQGVGKN